MTASRAFICGCLGPVLSDAETAFLRRWRPWGLILFRRNVVDRTQVAALARAFRDAVERADAPVLVDQEGGRVQRLAAPHWRAWPAAATFRDLADDLVEQERLVFLAARLMAHDLREAGITVDCMPVLDVPAPDGHGVIGDRAYSDDPARVAALGRAAARGMLAGGVLPVMKHMPGHGRARVDSHHDLPRVEASRAALSADFAPFRENRDLPAAMTAHVVFEAIDARRPATLSPIVVAEVIRGELGFDGLLMSDDLSMKALSGSFVEKTQALFAAGVDLALHCNGDPAEAEAVAGATPPLEGRARARADAALAAIAGAPEPFDPVDALAQLDAALARRVVAFA